MKRVLLLAALAILALSGCQNAKQEAKPASSELKTDEEKTLYSLGLILGRNIGVFNLTPAELDLVKRGLTDQVMKNKPAVELETFGPKVNELAKSRQEKAATQEKEKAKAFLEAAEKEKGAVKTASGLVYTITQEGTGAAPKPEDTVKVHYKGTLTDGTEFDSSYSRGEPTEFPLNGVIPCWTEGVGKLKVGGKAKLVCPSDIAYGNHGAPPKIPGGATLVFEVELLEVKATTAAPAMPGMPPTGMPEMSAPAHP